jgi:hypothetical protein
MENKEIAYKNADKTDSKSFAFIKRSGKNDSIHH